MDARALLVWAILPFLLCAAEETPRDHALAVFKDGDYKQAIPLLQATAAGDANDVVLRSSLLSALVYEGRLNEAADVAAAGEAAFPEAPEMLAARGEYEFYLADIGVAAQLFERSVAAKENARACYGLSRIKSMQSRYRSARLLCLRAHMLDPDDALITRRFLTYVPKEKREPEFSTFIRAHPWFYKDIESSLKSDEEIKAGLDGKKAFEQITPLSPVDIKLFTLTGNSNHGLGLEFRMNESHHTFRLLLDTGASGIILKERAVDKAELDHLGGFKSWGIGDEGKRNSFAAVSDTCQVGPLEFKHCLVRAVEGKRNLPVEADGLIGADFFSAYLIAIDFQKRVIHLSPLPPRPPDPLQYDGVISPDQKDFTPVLRQGNHLYIPTKLNDSTWGLFLLDTGASISNVDTTFARLSTKIRGNSYTQVAGVSGQVKKVFEADKALLQFARFRQDNLGLVAFDLNNHADEHEEFRLSGILGMPVLSLFRLTLDYRNGLVKFDYIFGEKKAKKKT